MLTLDEDKKDDEIKMNLNWNVGSFKKRTIIVCYAIHSFFSAPFIKLCPPPFFLLPIALDDVVVAR